MDVSAFDKNRRKGKDRKGKKGDKKAWSSYADTPVGKQTKKSQKKQAANCSASPGLSPPSPPSLSFSCC